MKRKIITMAIIPFFILGMIPIANLSHAQEQASQELINGLLTPRIDGLIDNSNLLDKSSNLLTEWGDASVREADFYLGKPVGLSLDQEEEEEEPLQARIFSKWVGRDFYMSFDFPKSTLSSVGVQFDFDNNGKLSNGDLRLVGVHLPAVQKGLNLNFVADTFTYGVENRLEIFMNGAWWDPSELNPSLWDSKNWNRDVPKWNPKENGYANYANLLSSAGKIAISPTGDGSTSLIGPMFDVELRFSPSSYSKFLKLAVPTLATSLNLNAEENTEIRYATTVKTTTGVTYGYPGRPTIEDNSNTFSMTEFVVDYYDFRIPTFLEKDVGIDHIEMTQTVQTADNELSLVLNKQSLARVFVKNPSTTTTEVEVTVTAYAFALITIIEIGSLSQVFNAPASPDRTVLSHSANFDMPDDWVSIPWLILKAEVTPIGAIDPDTTDNTLSDAFELKETHNMNIYYIRVNTGTAAAVNQASQATADSITSAFTASYPVANPTFTQLDWSVLGTEAGGWSDSGDLKDALTDIIGEIVLAIIFQILLGATDILPVPDQIFGIKPSGGGSSTPSWGNYDESFAAWGASTATSGSLVMAHEINHNIGDNNWGRHVGNPDEDRWGDTNPDMSWGCGASGPDAAWPTTQDGLNQLYTDTLGWNPGTGLVQNTKDDLMSYCNAGSPRKWISDYRWEELVDRLQSFVGGQPAHPTILSLSSLGRKNIQIGPIEPNFTINTRVISGVINDDGTGRLKPSYTRDGLATKTPTVRPGFTPTNILEVTYANGSTVKYEFVAEFNDHYELDHPKESKYFFTFWLPDGGAILGIRLLDIKGTLLHSLVGTGFTLDTNKVTFEAPTQIYRGKAFEVNWAYNTLDNSSNVFAQLQYSHDGKHWYNMGPQTTGVRSGELLLNNLPGGTTAKFKLILTDGFDTLNVVNPAEILVALLPPEVKILKNANVFTEKGLSIGLDQIFSLADPRPSPIGSLLSLKATAFDPQKGSIDPTSLTWTVSEVSSTGIKLTQSAGINDNLGFRHRFNKPGLYEVTVTATSKDGLTGSDSIKIRVIPAASIDQAKFDQFKDELQKLRDITTDESKFTDPGGLSETTPDDKEDSKSDGAGISVTNFIIILPFIVAGVIRRINRRKKL